jgi:hypothetical protein
LEHFDENYVIKVLFETLILQNALNNVAKWQKEKSSKLSDRDKKRLKQKLKKDVAFLNKEIKPLFIICNYLKDERSVLTKKIDALKLYLKPFRKKGF